MRIGGPSFYLLDIGSDRPARAPLSGDATTEVCIVGAGFTGLWAAWWLRQAMPELAIMIVEAERVGYGASGRNLGWLSAKPIGHRGHLAEGPAGRIGPIELRLACVDALNDIPALMHEHGVDIDAAHGGYLQVARTPAGMERIRKTVADRDSWHFGEDDLRLLDREEVLSHVQMAGVLGGLYSPHCVRIQPAKLALGLAHLLEASGVKIVESTRALRLSEGTVETDRGTVRARIVLRATEAYSCRFAGLARSIMPTRSCSIATEPLSEAQWSTLRWRNAEALYGGEHLSFFATRTADGRIVMAGAGFPYRFASGMDRDGEIDDRTIATLRERLHGLFPWLDLTISHAWSGVYGTPRDWTPSVSFDPATGLGHAGGYVGQGVAAAYLAGRTLADLVAGRQSRWTALPWTNRVSPLWEPEPLRWTGAASVYGLYRVADRIEAATRTPRTSIAARLATRINGRP